MNFGTVLWFTGLSGAGKTTITSRVAEILQAQGRTVKILDGDVVRRELHKHLGFTPEDIKENIRLLAQLCLKNLDAYDYVLVAAISPFRDARRKAREVIGKNFLEVYVRASLNTVIERDAKGLYQKALRGEIENFIGIDPKVPYEEPQRPDIILDTETQSIDQSVEKLLKELLKVSIVES